MPSLLNRSRAGLNRRHLQAGAGGYIIGEKLRSESPLVKAALSRQGRYQQVAGNLQVKEVRLVGAPGRVIICFNPDAAARHAAQARRTSNKLTAIFLRDQHSQDQELLLQF